MLSFRIVALRVLPRVRASAVCNRSRNKNDVMVVCGCMNWRCCTSGVIYPPNVTEQDKVYPEHISKIVQDIGKLNLIEVADLNELLKETLNIPDAPVMAMGAMAAMPSAAKDDEEEESQVTTKTAFTVKLTKFDPAKKVALIKEIKSIMDGMNLVQAKKFVEGAPADVKADLTKDEAEALKKQLETVGATIDVE